MERQRAKSLEEPKVHLAGDRLVQESGATSCWRPTASPMRRQLPRLRCGCA